jgi:hypothetical protein
MGIKLSPVIFVLALICFFLPFVDFSCQGQKVATLTGIQLVTGTNFEQSSMFGGQAKTEKVPSEPLAILSILCVILGLGLSFLKDKKSKIAPAISGLAGLTFLLLLKAKIDNDVLREGGGVLRVEYDIGFWLTFLLLLIAAGWHGYLFSRRKIKIAD